MSEIADLTHDSVFKELSSNRQFRVEFLKKYMPKELSREVEWDKVDLYSLNVEHTRQQDKDNVKQKEQSDVAFMFRFKDGKQGLTFCHIENQTTEDQSIILRSLHYQSSILLDYMKSNPKNKLPLIFSIIYYANKKPYKYSHNIYDYFEDRELAEKYAFKNSFIDLSNISDEELAKHSFLSAYEMIFKHIRQGDLEGQLDMVTSQLKIYDNFSRRTLIKYMSQYIDMQSEQFYDRIISNEPELKGDVMTVAEQSEAKGEARGKLQGIKEKANEMAIKMLKDGHPVSFVAKYSDLPKIKVQELKNSLKH